MQRKILGYLFIRFNLLLVLVFIISAFTYNITPRKIFYGDLSEIIFENEVLQVEKIGSIPRLAVSYNINGDIYATEDHYTFKNTEGSNYFLELGNFYKTDPNLFEKVKDFIARLRSIRKIRKNFGANDIVVLESGTILVFYDKIYRSSDNGTSFEEVYDFKDNDMYSPLSHGIAVNKNNDIYFGEYNCGPRPHKISIVKGSKDGTVWSEFYNFPSGELFHIHSIKYDNYRDTLWVSTGDLDEESKLIQINAENGDINIVGFGDQGWRAVSLIITENFLYWCSDNDRTGSNIYKYDFSTGERTKIKSIGKPGYYATKLKDGTLVISTAYEPISPYSKSYNLQPTADLWVSENGSDWHKILSLQGKIYETEYGPSRASIILPDGDYSSNYLFLTPEDTLNSDFSTLVLKITWKEQTVQ